eukprot:5857236-Amphidinium_carterae.1
MAQEMIATIATSTDGVQTETVQMTEAISARLDLPRSHLEEVPERVARVACLWNKTVRTRTQSANNIAPCGFSQQEASTACNKCDYEFSLYRKADARRQQEQFSQLQQTLRTSKTTVSELQQELVNAERSVTPRRIHIPTPDFGAMGTGASIQPSLVEQVLKLEVQVCMEQRQCPSSTAFRQDFRQILMEWYMGTRTTNRSRGKELSS